MGTKYPDVTVDLSRVDGNAVAIMMAVSKEIRRVHGEEAAREYREAARASQSYDALIQHAMGTVNTSYGDEMEA